MFYLLNTTMTLIDALTRVDFITSILLGGLGFAIICLARRITKTVRKTNFIASYDRVYVSLKMIGLVFVVIAFVILMTASLN